MQVLPPDNTGGPSRLFILRPVATTLLIASCQSPPYLKWITPRFRSLRSTLAPARTS